MSDDRWLSVDKIAVHLGVERDTRYKWVNRKSMSAYKVGRLWGSRKNKVDQWVKGEHKEYEQPVLRISHSKFSL